ncbi:MAG: Gfo/Idh/MocA family oxidoreductase [Verrucomicrobia bacterium]|nr:Gfo/Idh/MocA family oxidoreductase [Verrucomicrobiota bacterium]
MKKDIGIGVVGIGMGLDLCALNADPNSRFEVRGLCSNTLEKLEQARKKTGIKFITTDYHELLKRGDIHIIALFTPDHLHGRQCIEALNAGKHLVVTKPFTTSLDAAVQIARLADEKHLKVLVGETCRFYTSFMAAKKQFDEGHLGDLVWAEAWYMHQLGDALFDITPWRLTTPQDFLYGGVCHPMDSLVWFMGEVEEVHAYACKSTLIPRYPLPENFIINARFRSGKMARLVGSYGIVQPPYPMMGLALYGTRGSAVADFTDFEPTSLKVRLSEPQTAGATDADVGRTRQKAAPIEYTYPPDTMGAYGQGLAVLRYMADFEDAIVNARRPAIDAWEGVKTIAALAACWESIKSGKPAKVQNKF